MCVDFDGTCVEHCYPYVGQDVPYADFVLHRLQMSGVKIILWTMRGGQTLIDAVNWFTSKGITLYGVNHNPDQYTWTDSPKAYGQIYIDDAAAGCPLIYNNSPRPSVNWMTIQDILIQKGFIQ